VELDLRHIKTTLGAERLSYKTPEMATKELPESRLQRRRFPVSNGRALT
jgi:hypothetical protein